MKSKYYTIAIATIVAMIERIFDEAEQPISSYSVDRSYLEKNRDEYTTIYLHTFNGGCAIFCIGEEDSLERIKEEFSDFKRDSKKIGITLIEK